MKDKKKIVLIVLVMISLILVDQVIKGIIVQNFVEPVGIHLIKINLQINTGMALGLNEGNTKNILITMLILVLILNFAVQQRERIDRNTAISLIFIAAGGISNLIDRFVYKGVVDYIDAVGFPIFNLADIYVVGGWILLIIMVYKYSTKKE